MEEILAFIGNIDFAAIMTQITDFLATINFQEILDQIIAFVQGLING